MLEYEVNMSITSVSNKRTQKIIYTLLLIFGLFGLSRLYFRLTDDFRIANITHEMPYKKTWEVADLNEKEKEHFHKILAQKFYYVGKGAQAYAFSSEDGKYILKFFKFKHLKPSFLVDFIPELGPLKNFKQSIVDRKTRLLNSVFDGYRLAYDVHANETGLIYIHLNRSQNLNLKAQIVDKIGLTKQVDLDAVPFILQEKAITTRAEMTKLMNERDLAKAKMRIHQIFDLYLSEYSKGIYDRDHGVMHNTGFVQDKPIHLDVGKLTKDDEMKSQINHKPDLQLIVNKFNVWFKNNYPKDKEEFSAFMEDEMQKFFSTN